MSIISEAVQTLAATKAKHKAVVDGAIAKLRKVDQDSASMAELAVQIQSVADELNAEVDALTPLVG